MTEKQKTALETIISALPDYSQGAFREIAEYAMSLGYTPKLNKKNTYADFIKSKHKKTIMKIDAAYQAPRLAVRFNALPVCTGIFQMAVEERLKICGSYGSCKTCAGTFGDIYTLPNGKKVRICNAVIDVYSAVSSIPFFSAANIAEIKEALKLQDDFLMSQVDE